MGGGFIEWKGYKPPKKNPPKYPFATMKELRQHAEQNNLSIAEVILANEMSIPGRSEEEVYAFIDKITGAMVAIVKSGLNAPEGVVAGADQAAIQSRYGLQARAWMTSTSRTAESAALSAYALAGSEENGRGHLVVTAPTGGSAGVLPALVYGLGEGGRKLSQEKIRQGHACRGGDRVPVQAQCDAVCRRGRLPGGDRRGVGDGGRIDRRGIRRESTSGRECGGVGPGAPSWDDLRPGRRVTCRSHASNDAHSAP